MQQDFLFGHSLSNLKEYKDQLFLHRDVFNSLEKMQKKIEADYHCKLEIISAHRPFSLQLKIWNEKVTGKRAILDDFGNKIDPQTLTDVEKIFAILRWSALPGLSRHHWGTDFDVFDSITQEKNQVRLLSSEWEKDGPCHQLNLALAETMSEYNFFRPYQYDLKGVAPELWHLSYRPLSQGFYDNFPFDAYIEMLKKTDMALKDLVLKHSTEIYERFFLNITL